MTSLDAFDPSNEPCIKLFKTLCRKLRYANSYLIFCSDSPLVSSLGIVIFRACLGSSGPNCLPSSASVCNEAEAVCADKAALFSPAARIQSACSSESCISVERLLPGRAGRLPGNAFLTRHCQGASAEHHWLWGRGGGKNRPLPGYLGN